MQKNIYIIRLKLVQYRYIKLLINLKKTIKILLLIFIIVKLDKNLQKDFNDGFLETKGDQIDNDETKEKTIRKGKEK